MKKPYNYLLFVVLVAGSFLSGYWDSRRLSSVDESSSKRRVLYYVDPMNPSNTYNRPGRAPCGMKLEPVYADEETAAPAAPPADEDASNRCVLHYVDPMNPNHTSAKPGLAPSGMKFEPVFADEKATGPPPS